MRKLRAGLMPPAGRRRPDQATLDELHAWLETELDEAAAARPDPGRTATFHWLNRAEYSNAIRDLLALEIHDDDFLPAYDAGFGFDNIGGELHVRVEKTARMLANVGIRPTHVLWHQGESDVVADTPPAEYVAQFGALVASLAALGIDAPVFPAVATHCYFEDELRVTYLASAERIRRAQTSLPERIPNVWTGPTPNASSARGSTSTTSTAV